MARICFVSPAQLACNPRLLRNADCLAAAGHAVTVIYADHQSRFRNLDRAISSRAKWTATPLDFSGSSLGRLRWQLIRFRYHAFRRAFPNPVGRFSLLRNLGYFGPEIAQAACRIPADIYFAQQQQMIIPAAVAARRRGARFAVDIEDLLSENPSERVKEVTAVERTYYPQAALLCTMSEAAADYIAERYPTAQRPITLHNCPSLTERGLGPPETRATGARLGLYWFGQTIGPHSCADTVLRAVAKMRHSVTLVLRGNALPSYVAELRMLAAELGVSGSLVIEPPAPPDEMVSLAGAHEISLGTQPGIQLFHQLAIGNKVFTGMMSGAALVLSDTVAHRRLVNGNPQFSALFKEGDHLGLAADLDTLCANRERLAQYRQTAWRLAETKYNWERESAQLVAAVNALSRTTAGSLSTASPTRHP
jgi:glycosyltransferase involved in cell wall biosynthesis